MTTKTTTETKPSESMNTIVSEAKANRPSIEDMPLNSLRDYRLYNEEAARLNRSLGLKHPRYPLKQCPVELHPTERVIFSRNDQPSNPLPVFVSDDKIHFEKTLIPGQVYDLPKYIVHYLADKGKAIWGWVQLPNGETETQVVNKDNRFSLKTVYSSHD